MAYSTVMDTYVTSGFAIVVVQVIYFLISFMTKNHGLNTLTKLKITTVWVMTLLAGAITVAAVTTLHYWMFTIYRAQEKGSLQYIKDCIAKINQGPGMLKCAYGAPDSPDKVVVSRGDQVIEEDKLLDLNHL